MAASWDPLLLERERELALLDDALERACAGAGRLLVVEGPAGIGKTRLLSAGCVRGRERDMRVLVARGAELEREFSYGAVRQLFEQTVVSEPAATFAGPAAFARSLLDPAVVAAAPQGAPEDQRFAALSALFWLTAGLAEQAPLLLAVDDLQWCDESSVRFVDFLGRRLDGLAVLVICTVRAGEPGADVRLLESIRRAPMARAVCPAALTVAASAELVSTALAAEPDPAFVDACHDATGGNPLLLIELLRALAAERVQPLADHVDAVLAIGSDAVAQTVERRLLALSTDAARLVRAAAVLGDGSPVPLAAALADLDSERPGSAHVELTRVRILRPGDHVEFVHPLVRSSVYASLGDREQAHARAAHVLDAAGAPAEQVAAHLLRAAPTGVAAVVDALTTTARRALAAGDPAAAVAYLRRALTEPPAGAQREQVLFALGAAEALVEAPPAVDHLQEAARCAGDPRQRAEIAVVLARTLFFRGRFRDAAAVCAAALGEAAAGLRERLEVTLFLASCYSAAGTARAEEIAARVRAARPGGDFPADALQAVLAYRDARAAAPVPGAVDRAVGALTSGRLVDEDNGGGPYINAVLVLIAADSPTALDTCDDGLAVAGRRGSVFAYASNKVLRGRALLCRGALDEAEAEIAEGIAAADRWGLMIAPINAAYLADVQMERGLLAEAARTVAGTDGRGDLHEAFAPWLLDRRARLLLLTGEPTAALAAALAAGERFARIGGGNPAFVPWRSHAALALHALGDVERARLLVGDEVGLARMWGAPRALGRALRVAGLVAGGPAGLALLEEAVHVLDGSIARLELARAQVALGGALRRANRRAAARTPLRAGIDLALTCGARPLAEEARAELRAAGGRPRSGAVPPILTPSERRVAGLAAAGRTNQEIARTLYVAPKTVEMHLSNAYRKLGVGSRGELPAALAEPGP